MVDQDIQDQQYFVSQQHIDCITEPCNLISSANDDWLTVDITCLKETSLSQVDPGINITSKNLKVQDSIIGGIDSKADNQCCRIPSVGDLEYDVNNQFSVQDSSIMDGTSPGFYDSIDLQNDVSVVNYPRNSPLLWNSFMDTHNFKMDDVFQVDKADLFHGPTLAELNANDESLFDSFDSFDSCLPSENITSSLQFQSLTPFGIAKESNDTTNIDRDFKVESKDSNKCSELIPVKDKELGVKHGSQVHSDLSIECSVTTSTASDLPLDIGKSINICSNVTTNIEDSGLQAVPSESGNLKSILLNFKISDNTTVKEPFLYNEKEPANSSWGINDSHAILSLSNDGEVDNKDNTDDEYEFSSDYDSDASEQMCHKRPGTGANRSSKKPRYFWQYNMQAKGPKGLKLETFDHSHVSDTNSVNSLLKFRRGDGNDLAPCPQKLYNIGMELKKLNSVINNLTPVNELPVNARLKSRKEKNKLASRACRLKKKAQHEANKLKLFGLQEEYDSLIDVLNKTKRVLMAKIQNPDSNILCEEEILVLMAEGTKRVAGCTAEFVNDVLNSVEAGDSTGGLNNL